MPLRKRQYPMTKNYTIKSLTNRTLLVLPAVTMLGLGVLYGTWVLMDRGSSHDPERSLFETQSKETARQIGSSLSMAVSELELLAASDEVLHGVADTRHLRNHILRSRYLDSVAIYSADGDVELSTRDHNPPAGGSERLFDWAVRGRACVSQPNEDGADEDGGQARVFVPVKGLHSPGERVMVGVVPLDKIWSSVDVDLFDDNVALTLLRARTPDTTSAENADESHAILSAANHPDTYYVKEIVPRGEGIEGPAWNLVAIRPYEHVRAELERNAVVNVFAAILTLGVLGFVGVRFSRRIYQPLKELTSACNGILRGRLDVKMPRLMPNELQRISDAVGHMISEVRYHRNTMSEMVQSRTQNLEAAHKALERRADNLKASYNSSKDGVLVLDADGVQLHEVNQRFLDLFGLGHMDLKALEVDTLCREMAMAFMEGTDFSVRWAYYLENSEAEGTEEWELAQPERKIISVFTAPVRDEENVITGRYWTFCDVTFQRQQEEHLRQEQRLDAMGMLAGNFAHGIDNLLTVILGNLSLALLETDDNPDVSECLSTAAYATNQATTLAKELLGFANGGGALNIVEIDPNELLDSIRETLRTTVNPSIEIVSDVTKGIWRVPADSDQMYQAVLNICMNGVDSMSSGGTLTLRTSNVRLADGDSGMPPEVTGGDFVRITIADEGCGMSDVVFQRMFEPFFSTKKESGSQGLGLAMAYGTVRKHGGWITCESTPGVGTRFEVYVTKAEQRGKLMSIEPKNAETGNAEGLVLVVDDEPGVRRIAMSVLRRCGLATLEAADGQDALGIFEQKGSEIDVVLLDLSMPKLSGKETLVELKKMSEDVQVIICSGYPVDLDDFEREEGVRPDGSIQKPFDVKSLGATIREALERASETHTAGV